MAFCKRGRGKVVVVDCVVVVVIDVTVVDCNVVVVSIVVDVVDFVVVVVLVVVDNDVVVCVVLIVVVEVDVVVVVVVVVVVTIPVWNANCQREFIISSINDQILLDEMLATDFPILERPIKASLIFMWIEKIRLEDNKSDQHPEKSLRLENICIRTE